MKLNNKGIATKDMIFFYCLFVFLTILVYLMVINTNSPSKEKVSLESTRAAVVTRKEERKEENRNIDNTIRRSESPVAYYSGMENNLKNAAISYISNNRIDVTDGFSVSSGVLESSDYLDNFVDYDGTRKCHGYVTIYNKDLNYVATPYISCYDYETEGY